MPCPRKQRHLPFSILCAVPHVRHNVRHCSYFTAFNFHDPLMRYSFLSLPSNWGKKRTILRTSGCVEDWNHLWCQIDCLLYDPAFPSINSCVTRIGKWQVSMEGVRLPNTSLHKVERNLLRAEIQTYHARLNLCFLILHPNVLLRRSNYSDFYFLVNNHICHNWFNGSKAPTWQS